MFHLRLALVFIWIAAVSVIGTFLCLLFWGSANNNLMLGRMIAFGALPLLGMKVEVEDAERLRARQPCVFVANHQSALDVPICGSFCPGGMVAIGKKELKWIPFFGILFMASANVMIDRKNRTRAVAGLREVVEAIRGRRVSVFLFPEGTRNTTAEAMLPFKKGAFYMAVEAQVPIVPLVIAPIRGWVDRASRTIRKGAVRVKVLPPVETRGLTSDSVEALAGTVREQMMEAFLGLRHPTDRP